MSTLTLIPSRMDQVQAAMAAMRAGAGQEAHWVTLASAMAAAARLDQLARTGMRGHLDSATIALQAIVRRAMATGQWRPVELAIEEADDLQVALDLIELLRHRRVRTNAAVAA